MTRFIPAALLAAGSIALGLVAGNQARLISESDSAAAAAPAALPFLFFATAAATTGFAAAVSASDAIARR